MFSPSSGSSPYSSATPSFGKSEFNRGSARDRTQDFLAAISQNRKTPAQSKPPSQTKPVNDKSIFAVVASQLGKDLTEVTLKLDRLTQLAKTKDAFNDPGIEIQQLTTVINQDIKHLNTQIAILQQQKNKTSRRNKQSETHSDTVISTLQTNLRSTTKQFSQILEVRTETLKKQQHTGELYFFEAPSSKSALVPRKSILSSETKTNNDSSLDSSHASVSIDIPSSNQLQIYANDNIVASRSEAVMNIERMMGELQGIFQQLASLVAQQGELIQRIDDDVSNSLVNVNGAKEQIAKYLKSISSNRWLVIKIFAILFVFIIVFLALFI